MDKAIKKILRDEIKWCKEHPIKNASLSKLEQAGFVKGLRHAIRLIDLYGNQTNKTGI